MQDFDLVELEEAFYGQVAEEIRNSQINEGLWLKAFAEASGEKQLAEALYAKFRVAQLLRGAVRAAQEEQVSKEAIKKALARAEEFNKLTKRW